MEKQYALRYNGVVFHTQSKPPKLIQLGSGEILEWHNTRKEEGRDIADYRDASIEKFSYIHNTDIEAAL